MLSFSTLCNNINSFNSDLLFLLLLVIVFVYCYLLIIFSGESAGDQWVVFVLLKSMIKVSITKLFKILKNVIEITFHCFKWQKAR